MNRAHNEKLTPLAQALRTEMTKEERHLWYDFLRKLPITVHRQKIMGHYILDFYCAEQKIAIELDGSQHFDAEGKAKDAKRDAYLQEQGVTILRYSNLDVLHHFDGVCADILTHLGLTHLIP